MICEFSNYCMHASDTVELFKSLQQVVGGYIQLRHPLMMRRRSNPLRPNHSAFFYVSPWFFGKCNVVQLNGWFNALLSFHHSFG